MKIYVRKIDEQCVTHQISIRKVIWEEFFEKCDEFNAHGITSNYIETVKILPATDFRFSDHIKHVISREGTLEVGDILVLYKEATEYVVELVKPIHEKYHMLNELCERDQRHTLINSESNLIANTNEEMMIIDNLSEEDLGIKLREFYDSDISDKVTGIYLFGIKYGQYIIEKNYNKRNIVSISGINESYYAELNKAINISNFAKVLEKPLNYVIRDINESDRIKNAYNMIYYGTPGCGKSFLVDKNFNESEFSVFRTIFHPEYSNSDFVGQIIPKIDNNEIKYEFQEGPFSIALLNAIKNPTRKVCLIIEEINRGNASAIFGDIFQLLDRDSEGTSVYSIVNEPIRNYLKDNGVSIERIKIPSNLWIIATMNTSDQNVFTLDTAFKRRWRMHRIVNEFNLNEDYDKRLASLYIPNSSYTWKEFVTEINKEIMKKNPFGLNSEDKQLGVYFVTENELSIEPANSNEDAINKFVEKVLLYIWDDVAKIDSTLWFDDDIKSFDDLVKEYYNKSLRVFKDMFKDPTAYESLAREENEENS